MLKFFAPTFNLTTPSFPPNKNPLYPTINHIKHLCKVLLLFNFQTQKRKMVKQQLLFSFTIFPLLFLLHSTTTTLAQSPAGAPAPPGPTNITKILEKAGQFTLLIRLMKSTQVGDQINTQLNTSSQGLTMFAPTDNAFQSLKSGTLNSLTDEQQVQLLQFHVLPSFISTTQFQTATNPLRTQAGDSTTYGFPLNVTTSGNQVNVSTGVVNATVANTLYTDGQLAVYEVDKVLLPMSIFGPTPPTPPPTPSPSPSKTKKKSSVSDGPNSDDATTSGAVCDLTRLHGNIMVLIMGVAVISAFSL